jgi:ABC-type branched-subunit amino acid transport system substrate-binding protein
MRNKLALVLASLLMLGLLVPVAACKNSGEIKLGAVLDLSGALAGMGDPISKGVQLAVDQVNAAGGINGNQVRLILEDGKTTPTDALTAIKKLTEVDGVKVIIGPMISSAVLAAGDYVQQHQVLIFSPSATSPDIANQAWRTFAFRTAPSDRLQGKAMAQVAIESGYKKIVVFVMNNSYGTGVADVLTQELAGKATVLKTITYDPTKLDYLTELQQIKDLAPDCVMHVGYGDDGDVVYKQALQLGLGSAKWITSEGVYGESTLKVAEAAQFMAASVIGTRAVAPEGWPAFATFSSAFKASCGSDPSVYCDNVYDATMLALNAMKKVGSTDAAKIAAEILNQAKGYDGASGTITLGSNGDRVSSDYEVWNVVKDGASYKFGRVKIIKF